MGSARSCLCIVPDSPPVSQPRALDDADGSAVGGALLSAFPTDAKGWIKAVEREWVSWHEEKLLETGLSGAVEKSLCSRAAVWLRCAW